MRDSEIARGIDRIIENLRREVSKYATEAGRFEAALDRCQSEQAMIRVERDRLRARVNELEALACAHPACQLCQIV